MKHFPRVRVIELSIDDAWFRDTGPIFVEERAVSQDSPTTSHRCEVDAADEAGEDECAVQRRVAGLCWTFDAWGQLCYPDWSNDDRVGQKICGIERMPSTKLEMVLEGGSIHTDGQGTLLTTAECLLEVNAIGRKRNPGLTPEQIEAELKTQLGVSVVLWVPSGVFGDIDTSGCALCHQSPRWKNCTMHTPLSRWCQTCSLSIPFRALAVESGVLNIRLWEWWCKRIRNAGLVRCVAVGLNLSLAPHARTFPPPTHA